MRRLALSAFLLPFMGWGQAPANALLWKIDGNGLKQPNYLVGTVHSRDARAFGQVPQLLQLMEGVDAVAGELDLTVGPAVSMAMAQSIMMPPGKELSDFLSPRKLKRVQKAVAEEMGDMAMMAGRMKPFFLIGLLSESAMQQDSSVVLDQYLQEKAVAMGKEVLGLETVAEQLAAVDDLPLQEQANMLYDLVAHALYRKEVDRMMEAYAAQDLGQIADIAGKGGMPQHVADRLLTGRNQVMAQRMDSLMQGGRTFLFAIGAAHLPDDAGVLALLRGKGYKVMPVLQKASSPRVPQP